MGHYFFSFLFTIMNLAPTCRGTFLTRLTGLTRPPRLSESDGGQARFFYILYIQNIPSILSKKGNSYTMNLIIFYDLVALLVNTHLY